MVIFTGFKSVFTGLHVNVERPLDYNHVLGDNYWGMFGTHPAFFKNCYVYLPVDNKGVSGLALRY